MLPQFALAFTGSSETGSADVPAISIVPSACAVMETPLVKCTTAPASTVNLMPAGTMTFACTTMLPDQLVLLVSVPPALVAGERNTEKRTIVARRKVEKNERQNPTQQHIQCSDFYPKNPRHSRIYRS